MGWTTCNAPLDRTPAEFMRHLYEIDRNGAGPTQKIRSMVRVGSRFWIALDVTNDERAPAPYTTALMVEWKGCKGRAGYGWKSIDELMGPCDTSCPAAILDVLSPVEALPYGGGFAAQFRARCRAALATKLEAA